MNIDLIAVALSILKDEASGDVKAAASKMDLDAYSMTWMYKSGDILFPAVSGEDVKKAMDEVYAIQGRSYEIVNVAQGENVAFIELIESYPDAESGKMFRTPITLVLEFRDGKIVRGRHYTDPALSHMHLGAERIYDALGKKPRTTISGD